MSPTRYLTPVHQQKNLFTGTFSHNNSLYSQVYYEKDFKKSRVCAASGEDATCSNKDPLELDFGTNILYYILIISCVCSLNPLS